MNQDVGCGSLGQRVLMPYQLSYTGWLMAAPMTLQLVNNAADAARRDDIRRTVIVGLDVARPTL